MRDLVSELRKCPLLECLSVQTLETVILPAGKSGEYPKNTALFGTQDRVSEVKVLLEGKVNLCYYTENGLCHLHGSLLPPGVVGLDLICTKTKLSPYMAMAAEDSRVFSFPAELLLRPGTVPEGERLICIDRLLTLLSQLNMKKEYRIAILTQPGLRQRIMTYLTMQANRRQTSAFSLPFDREEMAAFLGVNRSALSHELGKLRKEGVIDFHRNAFRLLTDDFDARPGAEK